MPASLQLNDQLADALANAVRRGVPIGTAVQQTSLSQAQFYDWLKAAESGFWSDGSPVSPESLRTISSFSEKIKRARAEHQAEMIASIQRCATEENPKTGLPDWRAADAMLSKHPAYRKDWHEHRELSVDHTGTVQHEHTLVKQLEQPALLEAYDALDAGVLDTSENAMFSDP